MNFLLSTFYYGLSRNSQQVSFLNILKQEEETPDYDDYLCSQFKYKTRKNINQ